MLTAGDHHDADDWLRSEFSPLQLRVDRATGLPAALRSEASPHAVTIRAGATLTTGGVEQRGPLGGLVYDGAAPSGALQATGRPRSRLLRAARRFAVPVRAGGWAGEVVYTFRADAPSLTWSWVWRPTDEAQDLRAFQIEIEVELADAGGWLVNAPGNKLRRDVRIAEMPASTVVESIGGTYGSTGVLGFTSPEATSSLVMWPRSLDEIGQSVLSTTGTGFHLLHRTGVAAAASPGNEVEQDGIAIDLRAGDWDAVGAGVPDWFADLAIAAPTDSPAWTRTATLYEAQVGTSLFAGGSWTYSPYPEMAELRRDLPRIRDLGFDTIQLMPRQPFPSYNVVDYADIDLSYGDETELRRVVEWCHAHGMKVILDVLLHGVIDGESITEAADAVRSGPWADVVHAGVEEVEALRLTIAEQKDLSWSRHVIDFEAAWRDGSPHRHPLCDEHPEWFCTDSAGKVIGIYTKAFDMSSPQWQEYYSDAMVSLVERLGIDGFRFDAPTYNRFPNWSARTRSRASLQPLGAVALFRSLRRRLHAINPELMMYTEPNGALLRQSMDLNYNYDETWLPASLFQPDDARHVGGVHTGRQLAAWLDDRDRTLPVGSVTAHHIDSHDTFWWPLPGLKWRREQFGAEAAQALMCAFALSGGPYMMFVGGEVGMEPMVARVNAIRAERAELLNGSSTYGSPLTDRDELFTVLHRTPDGGDWAAVVVNMSSESFMAAVDLPVIGDRLVADLLADDELVDRAGGGSMKFAPYQARLLAPTPV